MKVHNSQFDDHFFRSLFNPHVGLATHTSKVRAGVAGAGRSDESLMTPETRDAILATFRSVFASCNVQSYADLVALPGY